MTTVIIYVLVAKKLRWAVGVFLKSSCYYSLNVLITDSVVPPTKGQTQQKASSSAVTMVRKGYFTSW